MEKRGASLAEIQEAPKGSLILLVGPPGAGKSTFGHQVVIKSIAAERPVIFVTTERSPSGVTGLLKEKGMGESATLSFVDAFGETVGMTIVEQPNIISANCEDLNSISMAITKLQQKISQRHILLTFDSLTSPYLFNKEEVLRFIRLCLVKFAAKGNSVLALMDEGCGKKEDLVAMMSIADGILKMEIKESLRIIDVIKHPMVEPTRIKFQKTVDISIPHQTMDAFITEHYQAARRGFQTSLRLEVGDFVNLYWPNLAYWSGMLWDPKRFPIMLYRLNKEITYQGATLYMTKLPWHIKLLWQLLPKRFFHSPRFIEKRIFPIMAKPFQEAGEGIMEYLSDTSKSDEHYIKVYESALCCGLEDSGMTLCYDVAAYLAGMMKFFDKEGRDWNAVETRCAGEGAPFCEFKVEPEECRRAGGLFDGHRWLKGRDNSRSLDGMHYPIYAPRKAFG
jgi:KaiC/GvpD/RAD55 family RecA-like ATPase